MFDQAYANEQLARSRHPVRSFVRSFYLSNLLRFLKEPALDIGCGAGQLLQKLPAGSIGTEVNPYLVNALQAQGLCVLASRPESPTFLSDETKQAILDYGIRAVCLSHVLEHFADAEERLKTLTADCIALNVEKLLVVVPGLKGYQSDHTHQTFITLDWIRSKSADCLGPYRLAHSSYFPFNHCLAGRFYIYNELIMLFRNSSSS